MTEMIVMNVSMLQAQTQLLAISKELTSQEETKENYSEHHTNDDIAFGSPFAFVSVNYLSKRTA